MTTLYVLTQAQRDALRRVVAYAEAARIRPGALSGLREIKELTESLQHPGNYRLDGKLCSHTKWPMSDSVRCGTIGCMNYAGKHSEDIRPLCDAQSVIRGLQCTRRLGHHSDHGCWDNANPDDRAYIEWPNR